MVYFITGGERSGRSKCAQDLALDFTEVPMYIAAVKSRVGSYEMRVLNRAAVSCECSPDNDPYELTSDDFENRVVVMDSDSLWLSDFFMVNGCDVALSYEMALEECDKIISSNGIFIFLTTQDGMGMDATSLLGRRFLELQYSVNEYIAIHANKVIRLESVVETKEISYPYFSADKDEIISLR